jgi:hypothetical protein
LPLLVGPLWVVGTAQQQPLLNEELHHVVADGFAGVGRVAVAVGGRDRVDDGGDATQGSQRVGPCGIRLEVEQGQQGVSGGFVPLLRTELQSGECLDGFGEALLPGIGFAFGGHVGAGWRRADGLKIESGWR